MNTDFLRQKFEAAADYEAYVATGTPEQQRRWRQVYDAARLSDAQASLLAGFTRQIHVLAMSGVWCGDCYQQLPLVQRIAEANPNRIRLRYVDRDQHRDLIEPLRINGGDRVPVVLFLAEDFAPCSVFGDRSLARYRALAVQRLGAACPIGVTAPASDELAATLADWLGEFERVQLLLRLSTRLRQKYQD